MKIKEIAPANFLLFRTEATVNELEKFIPIGQQLFAEAVKNKMLISGPVHWHYENFTDVTKPFTLEIALPVGSIPDEYDGVFHVKRTEPYKCVSVIHEGDWYQIPATYGKLMEFIAGQQLQPNARSREIYIHVDPTHPQANVTEIQLGVN